jgi:hypothetical protein
MRPKIFTVPNVVAAIAVFSVVLAAIRSLAENVTGTDFPGQAILFYIAVFTFYTYIVISPAVVAMGMAIHMFGESHTSMAIGMIAGAGFGFYLVCGMIKNKSFAYESTNTVQHMTMAAFGAAIVIGSTMIYLHFRGKESDKGKMS